MIVVVAAVRVAMVVYVRVVMAVFVMVHKRAGQLLFAVDDNMQMPSADAAALLRFHRKGDARNAERVEQIERRVLVVLNRQQRSGQMLYLSNKEDGKRPHNV